MSTYEDFASVDIRVGRIVAVEDFPEARKPAYKTPPMFPPAARRMRREGEAWRGTGRSARAAAG